MAKATQNISNLHHHNLAHFSTLSVKPVVKINEMEIDMYRLIEKWAIDCYEDPKLKIKDDIVSI
jgi:hypothetical protein